MHTQSRRRRTPTLRTQGRASVCIEREQLHRVKLTWARGTKAAADRRRP